MPATSPTLHKRHLAGLPEDRPLLRVANALPLAGPGAEEDGEGSSSTRLSDVHVGLPPPGIAGGSVHLVSGSYDYHHYMQVTTDSPCKVVRVQIRVRCDAWTPRTPTAGQLVHSVTYKSDVSI